MNENQDTLDQQYYWTPVVKVSQVEKQTGQVIN